MVRIGLDLFHNLGVDMVAAEGSLAEQQVLL